VVVDEAQDLSSMALRLVARRANGGSITLLGDLAQATAPHALGSWSEAVLALTADHPEVTVRHCELTVGYRVPASILDLANRLLPRAAPSVTPSRSVRTAGDPPLVVAVQPQQLISTVVTEVEALLERKVSVGVVADEDQLAAVAAGLEDRGVAVERGGRSGLPGAGGVAVLSPAAVKGLEFDAVVVVEPGRIAARPSGLRHLYVALTRAVQHLGIVHAEPLPVELAQS
jgi:DNA helicase IV